MADTVLITGASGLLGRWTRQHWIGDDVHPVTRCDVDLLRPHAFADLIRRTNPDVVVHLAWCASGTPGYRESDLNARWVEVTHDAVIACAGSGTAFYAVGTVVDDITPIDSYSEAKHRLRLSLAREIDSARIGWLRPFYAFDPAARRPALVAEALTASANRTSLALRSPDVRHDFIHASDVGRGISAAVHGRLMGVVDVGSGMARPVRELVQRCGAEWHAKGRTVGEPEDGRTADTSRLRALGWEPLETERFFS
jgi:nucleoside-diphosphate-sugar epimerase